MWSITNGRGEFRLGRLCVALCVLAACGEQKTHRRDIAIPREGITLAATVITPESASVRPGVVLIHGSGSDGRYNPYYELLAQEFVKRGFAVLIFDKRGSGQSQGDWRSVPFSALIDDAVAATNALRHLPEVDSMRVGIWGGSEGAAIAPEVARRVPSVAFVIMQSSPASTFAEQNLYQTQLQARGMTEQPGEQEAAMRMQRMKHAYARTGRGWDEYAASLREAQGRPYASLATPSDPRSWWWTWYRSKMDYSPLNALAEIRMPVLAIWGEADQLMPAAQSMNAVRAVRQAVRNPADSFVVVPHADHTLYISGARGILVRGLRNRPVTLAASAEWARRQVERADLQ